MTGLSHTFITRMANGKRGASIKNLEKIAAALGCTMDDLVQAPSVEDTVINAWAAIPEGRREDALRMLRALGETKPQGLLPIEEDDPEKKVQITGPTRRMLGAQKSGRTAKKGEQQP